MIKVRRRKKKKLIDLENLICRCVYAYMRICLKPKILPNVYAIKTEKLKLKYRDQNRKFK